MQDSNKSSKSYNTPRLRLLLYPTKVILIKYKFKGTHRILHGCGFVIFNLFSTAAVSNLSLVSSIRVFLCINWGLISGSPEIKDNHCLGSGSNDAPEIHVSNWQLDGMHTRKMYDSGVTCVKGSCLNWREEVEIKESKILS